MRVVRLDDDFGIDAISIPRFPVILDEETGVFLPAVSYLRELGVMQACAPGTLYDAAGIICGWINWSTQQRGVWDKPEVTRFVEWCRGGGAIEKISIARLRRRASVVFAFYEYLDRTAPRNGAIAQFVLELAVPIEASMLVQGRALRRTLRLKFPRAPVRIAGFRPTPNGEEIDQVLDSLLGEGSSYTAVRNWLLARVAVETGMRREGIAQMRITHLDEALLRARVLGPSQSLADMIGFAESRAAVRRRLDLLEEAAAQNVIVEKVREKGRVRDVAFPIGLVRQLTEYIWAERATYVKGGRAGTTVSRAAAALWLSNKSGQALKLGSISDIVAAGFRAAQVAGSVHRLRAAYCVALFRKLILEAHENGATKYHATMLLERVAQHMGHKDPETLRPYLHTAELEMLSIRRAKIPKAVECANDNS